jgi:protein-disulfide isomerase
MKTMITFRRIALASLLAPLCLGLAACGKDDKAATGPQKGDPVAAIPAPQGKSWTETVAVTPEGGYLMGNPQAPLKLIEYASLTCPHCADFSKEAAEPLRDKYVAKGVVSYELRNQIHDGLDLTMAMLVRCGAPESFHALSEQVWLNLAEIVQKAQANQAAMGAAMKSEDQAKRYKAIADAAGLTEFFAARGISSDQAATCLANSAKAEQIVQNSQKQSEELQVDGTPTFFLNGSKLEVRSWKDLEPILQDAGAR